MVCTSAEELQGRLLLLGLCKETSAEKDASAGFSAPSGASFHDHIRAEVDGVLKDSLDRRLKRFEQKVNRLLKGDAGASAGLAADNTPGTNGDSSPTSSSVQVSDMSVQTHHSGEVVPPNKLVIAHEKAIKHAMHHARPPVKKFVEKKCRQNAFAEPAEKEEPIKKESFVMKATLDALKQNTSSRERQIFSLKAQIEACKEHVAREEQQVARASETHRSLHEDHGSVPRLHEEWHSSRKIEHEKLQKEAAKMKSEAKRYEVLAKQQHAFFLQTEAIFQRTGQEKIHRSPSGDLFLMPQPLPMDEDEKIEEWDVGTAFANPYVVDSWPFEPNVLARRCSQEATLDEVREETFEDLVEARRPVSRLPPVAMNFGSKDSDDDDDGVGPSATSRSL